MAEKLKYKYILFLVLVLYIVLVFVVGYYHEPWADEAQSWMLSKDNGFYEIFKETKFEGHPFVWFFIERTVIKFFSIFINPINLYNYLFLLPLFCSVIGIYLFLYKSNFPLWIKTLCPFTFYIFYQYGIVARNHCLCFPMLAIIATFYQKRFEHPYIYITLLIINANISAYLYVISCILLLFFIIDIIKDKLKNRSFYISVALAAFLMILSAVNMYTTDGYFWDGLHFSMSYVWDRLTYIANIYFPTKYSLFSTVLCLFLTVLVYFAAMKVYCKNTYQRLFFILLNLSLYIVFIYVYMQNWHYGYAFIILLFSCWILADINKIEEIPFKKNILFYSLFCFILGYYIINSIAISYYDIKNNYSGSKDAVEFIKKYNLQDYKITAIGMKTVAFQPYFAKNIYNNYVNTTHFSWKNDFYRHYNKKRLESTPIFVLANFDMMFYKNNYEDLIKKLDDEYNKYVFSGEMRGLNYKNGNFENNSYTIYIDKDLAKSLNIADM